MRKWNYAAIPVNWIESYKAYLRSKNLYFEVSYYSDDLLHVSVHCTDEDVLDINRFVDTLELI